MRAVQDLDVASVTGNDECHNVSSHDGSHASLDPLVIKVTNIPLGVSEEMFHMIVENKRYGGGAVRRVEFSQSEQSAVVEYEDRAGMYS